MSLDLTKTPAPPTISEAAYRAVESLGWRNEYTAQVSRETGVATFCMAYNPHRHVWLLANRIRMRVAAGFQAEASPRYEMVPYVWGEWRDDNGLPLAPYDPRLVAYVRKCDLHNDEAQKAAAVAELAMRESQQRDSDNRLEAIASDDQHRRAVAAFADSVGHSPHRLDGNQGGRIANTALWRG